MEKNILKIGIIGLGTVGSGVVKTLKNFKNVEIVCGAVRNLNKKRDVEVPNLTDDPFKIVNDPEIDVVVEVAGGCDPALDLITTAIKNKKHVVTANKELLAKFGGYLKRHHKLHFNQNGREKYFIHRMFKRRSSPRIRRSRPHRRC